MDEERFKKLMLGAAEERRREAFTRLNTGYLMKVESSAISVMATAAEVEKVEENYWRVSLGMKKLD